MPRGRPRKNPEDVLIRSAELIGWALGGLEREIVETRKKLVALTAQAAQLRRRAGIKVSQAVAAVGDAEGETIAVVNRARRRRKMSPEARKRISEMMKKRWAERKKLTK